MSASVVLTFLVGQRAPFVALAIYIAIVQMKRLSIQKIMLTSTFFVVLFGVVTSVPAISESRIGSTLGALKPRDIVESWIIAIDIAQYTTYESFVFDNRATFTIDGDLSAHLRIRKWAKAYTDFGILNLLVGLGPDYFGKGADSGAIRLFASFGIIVTAAFYVYMNRIYSMSNKLGKGIVSILLICNFFLDLSFSVLIMCFSGLILACYRKDKWSD